MIGKRISPLALAALLLSALPTAGAAPSPHGALEVELAPGQGRLQGRLELRMPSGEPLSLTLGEGFALEAVEIGAGSVQRLGDQAVNLHPRGPTRAELRWSGAPPADGRDFLDASGALLTAASGWYPQPGPRPMRYSLTVALPARLQAVASGTRLGEQRDAGRRRVAFEHPAPGSRITLVAGEWEKAAAQTAYGSVYTFFPERLAGLSADYLERAGAYLERFGDWIGPPPHGSYAVVAAPLPVGYAFPGFTYIGERVLQLPFIPRTSLPHEVLHEWWGNGVYIDYADGNWAEGLTQYMADYHQARRRGPGEARRMRGDWLRGQAALPAARDYPLRRFRGRRQPRDEIVGYQRAAFLFHTLHRRLGASGFAAALRAFYADNRHRPADWADVREAFTDTAIGRERRPEDIAATLSWFVETTGAPRLRLAAWSAERGGRRGGYRVEAEIAWDEDAYPARIPVVVETADGGRELRRPRLEPGERRRIRIATESRPEALAVDPDFHVYRRLAVGEGVPTLRDLFLARRVRLVSPWPGLEEAARRPLAGRLERGEADAERALLLVGPEPFLRERLAAIGACTFRRTPPAQGEAVAWAGVGGAGKPVLAVAAESAAQAGPLLRRLGHYGRHSYVAFGGEGEPRTGLYATDDRHGLRVPLRVTE